MRVALAIVSAIPHAAASPAGQPATAESRMAGSQVLGTHATSGVVHAIDATTMVVGRRGRRGDMTFVLTPSTRREGTIVVGSMVSVRYNERGERHVATAVALQRGKE